MEAARAAKPVESRTVVACAGGEATELETRPLPEPGPGEMLLGLRVVGFCGTDLFKLKTGSASPGTVLGHELVGDVVALGSGVKDFAIGDRVVVPHHVPCGTCIYCRRGNETMCAVFKENLMEPGGFADAILIRPRAVEFAARKVPGHLSDESAVFMEPAACVLRGIERSGLGEEGVAVVLGAGSMGLLHLLVLKAVFPRVDVVMVDFDADRLALAVELGAARTAEPGEETAAAVRALTEGVGADAVFDTVGGEKALAAGHFAHPRRRLDRALRACARRAERGGRSERRLQERAAHRRHLFRRAPRAAKRSSTCWSAARSIQRRS